MGFSSSRWTVRCVSVLSLLGVFRVWASGDVVSVNCGECEKSRCPELHYCEGRAVKDQCGCCTVCSSDKFQPHPLVSGGGRDAGDDGEPQGNACAKVKCPKFKVCVENMQGLPLCTCPGSFICKQRRSRQRPVCGTDGNTYESRCLLRIAACNTATRIKVTRRGPCTGAEGPRARACDSVKSCRRRKNQQPVCGTDGKTYASRCHMKIAACQRGVKIKMKHHNRCASSPATPARGSLPVQRGHGPTVPARTSSSDGQPSDVRSRKGRRRRKKKKGGSDVAGSEDGKRKRRKQRRDQRKKKQQRRRKRRKTRGRSRQRRYKMDRKVSKNIGHTNWK
ncbi:follistatin-like [Babylonia areolata]|uniref:follistatin-like n=1 Tax=Babylonia areolata TaxID=304850 RepID=UPI003FD62704